MEHQGRKKKKIFQGQVLKTSIYLIKENNFTLKKARSRQYPAETVKDADYAYDLVLLANTPAQAESLLRSLK